MKLLIFSNFQFPVWGVKIRSKSHTYKWTMQTYQIWCYKINGAVKISIWGVSIKKWILLPKVVFSQIYQGLENEPGRFKNRTKVILDQLSASKLSALSEFIKHNFEKSWLKSNLGQISKAKSAKWFKFALKTSKLEWTMLLVLNVHIKADGIVKILFHDHSFSFWPMSTFQVIKTSKYEKLQKNSNKQVGDWTISVNKS